MSAAHALESLLARAALGALGGFSWRDARRVGAALGDAARTLGVRRAVARANLAGAFPERDAAAREAILVAHYREVGRIAAEYGRLPQLARAPDGEAVVEGEGVESLRALAGRGVLMLAGHYGFFELAAAHLARYNPVDFLVRPLKNPAVDERVTRLRRAAGVGVVSTHGGVKQIVRALRAGHWIAIAADQDAGRQGVFVPFFGRPASTAQGAARLALQAGIPMTLGTIRRQPDGRHRLIMDAPAVPEGPADDAAIARWTAWHTALLERRVREAPEHYFWLHRRWKTRPAEAAADGKDTGDAPL